MKNRYRVTIHTGKTTLIKFESNLNALKGLLEGIKTATASITAYVMDEKSYCLARQFNGYELENVTGTLAERVKKASFES